MFDEIDLNEEELPFNPILNMTVAEFLDEQKVASGRDPDAKYECRRCGDCCKWNYFNLIPPQTLIDQIYMVGPKYPHGYWVLIRGVDRDSLHLYMPTWTPREGEAKLFHFEGNIPLKHIDFFWRTGRTHGYWVLNKKEKIVVYCPCICQHLTEDGLCSIYEDRPLVCQEYLCGRYPMKGGAV